MGTVIESIRNEAERFRLKGIDPNVDERMQMCLERFAQSVQLGIISHVITGSIPQLLCRLDSLPQNTLLRMVIKSQRGNYL